MTPRFVAGNTCLKDLKAIGAVPALNCVSQFFPHCRRSESFKVASKKARTIQAAGQEGTNVASVSTAATARAGRLKEPEQVSFAQSALTSPTTNSVTHGSMKRKAAALTTVPPQLPNNISKEKAASIEKVMNFQPKKVLPSSTKAIAAFATVSPSEISEAPAAAEPENGFLFQR
jgi:hypothetical protein